MTAPERFAAAQRTIAQTIAIDATDPTVDPRCRPYLLHHDGPTERAIVLFHGFTNCPRQFAAFAALLFDRGCNVYVPRLPRHGLRDKLTTELAQLTSAELTACAVAAVQAASGLGDRLSTLGLSVGATIAAWLAQTQPLDRAVAVAPFFSVAHVPGALEPALTGTLERLPNLQLWWDPRVKARAQPDHAYPRFATHALAQCLRLGAQIRALARAAPPRARGAILVLNAKDPAVDNAAARAVWESWRTHGASVDEYTFGDLDVRHDIIEPVTYPAAAQLVYPTLLRELTA